MGFWDTILWIFVMFAFVAYLFALFAIIADLFRDHKLSGWGKAIWMIFLIFLPILTSLVYLIARGDGMAQRAQAEAASSRQAADAYIRATASTASPAEQISQAKALLDSGTIDQREYEALKAKALS